MSNGILTDTRELKIDELEMVSGGSLLSTGMDFTAGLLLGALGVGMVMSAVHVAAKAAKAESQM
jgi:hypothetical protein